MTDPVVTDIKTDVTNEVTKVKSLWLRYEVYVIALVCMAFGAYLGHKF